MSIKFVPLKLMLHGTIFAALRILGLNSREFEGIQIRTCGLAFDFKG